MIYFWLEEKYGFTVQMLSIYVIGGYILMPICMVLLNSQLVSLRPMIVAVGFLKRFSYGLVVGIFAHMNVYLHNLPT